jgi:hypothetical protein
MNTSFLTPPPLRRRKWLRRAGWALLAYTLIGFLILPPIIRAVAVKQLSKQLDREVSIQKLRLNPFVLSATVRGLLIKDKDGEPFISWDEVRVNFQITSFFGKPWVFEEVSTTKPFVRVQVNKDYTLNFTDLITKFTPTNTPATPPKPSKPLALRISRLQIGGATASFTDLTPRTPFARVFGPLDVTLTNFRTDPDNRNPYSFNGTTDAGEKFAWRGYFFLDPLRSQGEFALQNITLTKYAPLYEDFVRFVVKDGTVDVGATYRFELSASNRVASVTNAAFALHSFKLADPGSGTNIVELPEFAVSGASVDAMARTAEINSITSDGGRLRLRRNADAALNVVELSKPADGATNAPGGILLLLRSVTNAVAMLLSSTNARPARLELDNISLTAKNISNVPGTNLTATLTLRWNTNGTVKVDAETSFALPTADVQITLDKLELKPLDPYLEPKVNVFILDSKLSLTGKLRLRTATSGLPEVTFQGDARLDDFASADGVLAEDLLKWSSVRVSGLDANLNPPAVTIKEIAVDDAYARVVIETNGTINLLAALHIENTNAPAPAAEKPAKFKRANKTAVATSVPAPETNAPTARSLPKISIGSVVFSNAQLRLTDRSITPAVNMAIQQLGGTISRLSSDELQHADVNLHAKVDNGGPVEITGTINPLGKNLTMDLKITMKDADLTPTSPYSGKFAGYRIAKGKLGVDLAYKISDRKLAAKNLIILDQFTFGEKVDSPDATKLPVKLGVAVLKDRNGRIELDVPVEGSLDDPQFRLGKVIGRAILNVITKIITSPFAVLGSLFGGKGEEISYQDFPPGSSLLLTDGKSKLDSLASGLYERPALQLEIEGSVDPDADRKGLRQVRLYQQLRTKQWMSLRKSERATATSEQITLAPEDRAKWVTTLYVTALEKGDMALTRPTTNQIANIAAEIPPTASRRPAEMPRGAAALLRPPKPGKEIVDAGVASTPSPAGGGEARPAADVNEMAQALMDAMVVTDADLATLAADRAKAVREYILQSGKAEAERIFLTENQPGGVKNTGSRAYLQLK